MNKPSFEVDGVGAQLRGARIFSAAIASVVLAGIGSNSAEAAEPYDGPKPTNGWELEWASDFNQDSLPDPWTKRLLSPNKDSQEYSIAENVYVKDGKLILRVARHCLKRASDPATPENQTSKVCQDGEKTVYSSGRIETKPMLKGNYRVEVKADLSLMDEGGTRTAIWTKNMEQYCNEPNTLNAEFDILEYYTSEPNTSTATSHMVCEHGDMNSSYHKSEFDSDWKDKPHVFAEEVVDNTITYFVDDKAVKHVDKDSYRDGKDDFKGITNSKFFEALVMPQAVILNTEGFNDPKADSKAFRAPDPDKEFPMQYAVFEYVRIYTK